MTTAITTTIALQLNGFGMAAWLTPLCTAILIVVQVWQKRRADAKAAELLMVAEEAKVKAAEILEITAKTHTLVNGVHGEALSSNARLSQVIVDLRGTPADVQVAKDAQAKLSEHQEQEAKVDADTAPKNTET